MAQQEVSKQQMVKIALSTTAGVLLALVIIGLLYFMALSVATDKVYKQGYNDALSMADTQLKQAIEAGQIIIPTQRKEAPKVETPVVEEKVEGKANPLKPNTDTK